MARTPAEAHQRISILDRLIFCLWWLIFLGGIGAGATAGIILALWLTLAPLPALLLIVACWLGGNAAGWRLAARADTALTQRIKKRRKCIHDAAFSALPKLSCCGFPRPQGTGWYRSPGLACP